MKRLRLSKDTLFPLSDSEQDAVVSGVLIPKTQFNCPVSNATCVSVCGGLCVTRFRTECLCTTTKDTLACTLV
jgi:hypothetical protein